jgi:hypothetical protein
MTSNDASAFADRKPLARWRYLGARSLAACSTEFYQRLDVTRYRPQGVQ